MIDSIGETIVRVVGPIVPVYLSEAETESYPYAVCMSSRATRA